MHASVSDRAAIQGRKVGFQQQATGWNLAGVAATSLRTQGHGAQGDEAAGAQGAGQLLRRTGKPVQDAGVCIQGA